MAFGHETVSDYRGVPSGASTAAQLFLPSSTLGALLHGGPYVGSNPAGAPGLHVGCSCGPLGPGHDLISY